MIAIGMNMGIGSGNFIRGSGDEFCLSFDGVDDYVRLNGLKQDLSVIPCSFTAWVKTTHNDQQVLLTQLDEGGTGRVLIRILADGKLETFLGNASSVSDSPPINDGEYHHVGFTYSPDDSQYIFYAGGVEVGTFNIDAEPCNGTFILGARKTLDLYFFNGIMDDVRIYDIALTPEQIQATMHRELYGDEPGLVAYYKFNEGSGTIAHDSAGSNDGTIVGATWTRRNAT